jgi:Xaa-Pro dipeptidase
MSAYGKRLERLQRAMERDGIDLAFFPRSTNLQYLTGIERGEPNYGNVVHPGEWVTGVWIARGREPILTFPRMVAEKLVIEGFEVRALPDVRPAFDLVREVIADLALPKRPKIALDERTWADTLLALQQLVPDATFASASDVMMPIRMIKDEEEIATLRKIGAITEAAYEAVLPKLQHGMTSIDIIHEVNYQMKLHGSYTNSFATALYVRSPLQPFSTITRLKMLNVPLLPPVAIAFDFGGVLDGYCYDYGRSVHFGEPTAEYQRAHALVMASQAAGIAAMRPGASCESVDAVAREVIEQGGYGPNFVHRLGHAIGMDVHEVPFLMESDTTPLQEGMCFTVEPSIGTEQHEGAIHVRVEDIVVVRPQGGEKLTSGHQEFHVVA